MNPRPESRVESLEKRATAIEAGIIELSSDTAEELKAIRQEIKQLNDGMMSSFKKIGDTFIDTVANKEDLTAMEGRITGEIAQIKATQIEQGQRQDKMDSKLDLILQLLQKKDQE